MRSRKVGFVILLSLLFIVLMPVLAQESSLTLTPLGTYATGVFAEGAQEIAAYHAPSHTLFVVNANAATVDVVSIADPTAPTLVSQFDATAYGDSANSVAVSGDLVAVAVEAAETGDNGQVVFLAPDGTFINAVEVGALPDMVTFTPDGTKVLIANEGEPASDYSVDPEGTISVIDVSGGAEALTQDNVTTIGFSDFNVDGPRAAELPANTRIYGPNATVAQDVEPEYIAVSPDSLSAFVTLQEANVYAYIDLATNSVVAIYSYGFKDFSAEGNGLDAGADDGTINITNWPVFGIYQPDAIATYATADTLYLITANEGDTRDYDAYSEEGELGDSPVDEAFPDLETLTSEDAIGGLGILTSIGDTDGDGDLDQLYIPGGRSFSIYNALTGEQVYDSGDDFEQVVAEMEPDFFNSDHEEPAFDDRSDNKGPEPEALALGSIDGRSYAFIGFERQSAIVAYDITDPTVPVYLAYAENHDFTADPTTPEAGDLGPESMIFISAENSPIGTPLLVVANEISGTTTVWQISIGN